MESRPTSLSEFASVCSPSDDLEVYVRKTRLFLAEEMDAASNICDGEAVGRIEEKASGLAHVRVTRGVLPLERCARGTVLQNRKDGSIAYVAQKGAQGQLNSFPFFAPKCSKSPRETRAVQIGTSVGFMILQSVFP